MVGVVPDVGVRVGVILGVTAGVIAGVTTGVGVIINGVSGYSIVNKSIYVPR